MNNLLHSKFETYLLDEELYTEAETVNGFENKSQEHQVFPEGFFSEL